MPVSRHVHEQNKNKVFLDKVHDPFQPSILHPELHLPIQKYEWRAIVLREHELEVWLQFVISV